MSENNQIDLRAHFEQELEKAREATSLLQDERQVSVEILHETFTL